VIGRFGRSGIRVDGPGATGNRIEGNFVGIDPSGTRKAGNGGAGVRIRGGTANVVGGADPTQRNVISGNGDCPDYGIGVRISSASDDVVQGNYIGTDRSGTRALEDCRGVGSSSGGVAIEGYDGIAANNTVGGTVHGVGNMISANVWDGVDVGAGSSGTRVEGNEIRGNGGNGVTIVGDHNTVGGTAPGAGNRIFDNERSGVQIVGYTGNRVLTNEIFANDGLAIDLGAYINNTMGVTANDAGDTDAGSNNLQNYPVISSATRSASTGTTTLTGTLNSNPSQNYTIQCFLTDAGGDPSGHGEGETLLDTATTATDADGDSPAFTCTSDIPAADDKVTMTATNTATPRNFRGTCRSQQARDSDSRSLSRGRRRHRRSCLHLRLAASSARLLKGAPGTSESVLAGPKEPERVRALEGRRFHGHHVRAGHGG
jgi:hypothetical protein